MTWPTPESEKPQHRRSPAYENLLAIFRLDHGTKAKRNINDVRYSDLYYKTGFALSDSAQLSAKVSVLSPFQGGWIKRPCSVG